MANQTRHRAWGLTGALIICSWVLSACAAAAPTPAPPTAAPTVELAAQPAAATTPPTLDKTYNILVMGVDHRPTYESWRTDSLMVVAIDFATGQVGVVSIPRDLYVDIPEKGKARINEADFYGEKTYGPGGGPQVLAEVVERELGIPTQHYARIQMDGLVRLVDALGGVTVHLDCPLDEATPNPSNADELVYWSLPAGDNVLDGPSAKKFATYRYLSNDFSRVRRQQQLIWAVRNRALQPDVISRIPELWQALGDTFVTDLKLLDVITLARVGTSLKPENVHGVVLSSNVLTDIMTPEGWNVLIVRDPAAFEELKAGLFSAKPLSELGTNASGECD
jgi:LCP family protein required for cell wall assembly